MIHCTLLKCRGIAENSLLTEAAANDKTTIVLLWHGLTA